MAAAEEPTDLNWGLQFSVSSAEFAALINKYVSDIGLKGLDELNDVTASLRSVTKQINDAIKTHIASGGTDVHTLPIILMIKYPPGSTHGRLDPRNFAIGDYVIVYTNNAATAINTSAVRGIYRVNDKNDDTVTVVPANIYANALPAGGLVPKTRCALLRRYNGRLIIMVLDHDQSAGGAKSGGSRRTRRPSRSKSLNKKRKYTQQRVRRRSHRR